MPRFIISIAAALLAILLAGCKKETSSSSAPPQPSPADVAPLSGAAPFPPEPKVMDWLLGVLQQHGIAAQRTRDWITFAGTDVALSAGLQPDDPKTPKRENFVVLQVNFSARLPGGRMILQPVAGFGETRDAALAHAEASFLLGTFHVLLGAFVDPDEKHVRQEQRTIAGTPRLVTIGDIVGKQFGTTQPASKPADDTRWQEQFRHDLDTLGVPPGTHWIDIYNGFVNDKQILEIQLDNKRWPQMEEKMRFAAWPRTGGATLTSVRQFLVVQDENDVTRPKPRPQTRPATNQANSTR
jgi:hypothetical protein